ncbi:MAG: T9SS type A sorting domain-containing protein [Candidatus Eisenbacteria bacterium]|nr:T9SS type A sorting domain-containing protein [Candidatus Eisenbacteria bacterium]
MAKIQLCILLSIGLLATGITPVIANSQEVSTWRAAPVDTSRALGPDGLWNDRPLWSRGDPRLRRRAGPGADQPLSASPSTTTSRRAWTQSAGQLVADPNLWGADGNVLDIARSGNTLYIAGSFRSVGENSGGFVPIDARTAEALGPFPKVAGSVAVILPDSSGGWYIGGEFTAVAGKPRSSLAQIRADGSVTDWNPSVTGSPGYIDPPAVVAMAIYRNRLFVGGAFREIGGQPHENLGCVDVRTGAVLDWNLDTNVDGWVSAFAVHDSTVFVGGTFTTVGGQARSYLAALDATTGALTPWQANPDYSVLTMLVREDTLLAGGQFGWIAGSIRPYLAALDVHTAQLLPFNADVRGIYVDYTPTPRVSGLALVGDTLYAAGNFTQIGRAARSSLAALNATTGDALPWVPPALGPQYDGFPPPLCGMVAVSDGTVYVGGWFETVGGESRPFVAALDRETGAPTTWNPKPNLPVSAVVTRGDTVYMGGIFSLVGEWRHRAGLAAIDLTSGIVRPWNPNPNGSVVTAVLVDRGRVFVSGGFTSIGGQPLPRSHFAALDTINGEATDWNPGANGLADALLMVGDTLYAGGYFTQVGGQTRNYLAAMNASTGEVTAWDANASWPVLALARSGNTLYAGGLFQQMGGQWRRGIAAVDATTGALTPWNPDTDYGFVEAIVVGGNTVYAGGVFHQIGGQARKSLAALDIVSGAATAWDPHPTEWDVTNPRIYAMALCDSVLYVGGSFASIGGQPRICLAAVDTATGLATDWDPGTDGRVWSLTAEGNTIYAGGGFTRAGGLPAVGLAAFSLPEEPLPTPVPFALAQSIPNPAHSSAIIRFALPEAAPVTLSVYDLQGRRVATLLDHVLQAAGRHDVPVQADRWKPGVYLYRLEARGRSATRKMVVVE